MVLTQNETRPVRNSECGIRNGTNAWYSAIRNPPAAFRPFRSPHSAFTLTELLVVIAIIAVLASLITAAAINALNRAKQAAITLELQQLGGAVEDFKNEYGAYPPNTMVDANNTLAQNDIVRMFKKAFPRNQEPAELILALVGGNGGGQYNVTIPNSNTVNGVLRNGLTGEEALVFWLGGFSKDPSYPISGPGGPSFDTETTQLEVLEDRNLRYEFDLGRFGPRNTDNTFNGRFIQFDDPKVNPPGSGNRRQINLWTYSPANSQLPYVYIDTSRHDPDEYDLDASGVMGREIYALKQLRQAIVAANSNQDIQFVEDKKFQIMHCGTDDIWGDQFSSLHLNVVNEGNNAYQNVILAPEGPFIGDIADTLGNFMEGTLEGKQE